MNHERGAWVWSIPCWDSKNFNELRQLRKDQSMKYELKKTCLADIKTRRILWNTSQCNSYNKICTSNNKSMKSED